jgi:hypothetical protein
MKAIMSSLMMVKSSGVGDMADSGYENIVCRLPGNLPAPGVGGGQGHLPNSF